MSMNPGLTHDRPLLADGDLDLLAESAAPQYAERVQLLQRLLREAAWRKLSIYPIPDGFNLTVVMPVFNEEQWIREIIRRVQAVPIPKEIVLVDDFSTDGTRAILAELQKEHDNLRV